MASPRSGLRCPEMLQGILTSSRLPPCRRGASSAVSGGLSAPCAQRREAAVNPRLGVRVSDAPRAGPRPKVLDVLAWHQCRTPEDLLDHGHEALIALPLVDVGIAVPAPTLPGDARPVLIG